MLHILGLDSNVSIRLSLRKHRGVTIRVTFSCFSIDTVFQFGIFKVMTWFIQFIAQQPFVEGGSKTSLSLGSLRKLGIRTQRELARREYTHKTAQFPQISALVCTCVQLRAPACTKMKNFRNGAQTTHNCTFEVPHVLVRICGKKDLRGANGSRDRAAPAT
jgi:hypothetical protein